MKKIQQGYSRVTVELLVLFAIIYAGIQNVFGKEPYSWGGGCWPLNVIFLNSCCKDSEMCLDTEVTLKNV